MIQTKILLVFDSEAKANDNLINISKEFQNIPMSHKTKVIISSPAGTEVVVAGPQSGTQR